MTTRTCTTQNSTQHEPQSRIFAGKLLVQKTDTELQVIDPKVNQYFLISLRIMCSPSERSGLPPSRGRSHSLHEVDESA